VCLMLCASYAGEVSTPQLDCKASIGQLHTVQEVTVAHGDEGMGLDDFLVRVGEAMA
jgi:hypothetical protein